MANEKRLIDANALDIPDYGNIEHPDPFIEGYRQGKIDAIIDVRALAPTVDAVEVEEHIKLREQYDKIFLEYHELRDNFISYVCSGISNPSPFCLNKRRGCCDSRGWCKNDDKCQGFNPAEVILDGAKMDGDGNGK